MDVNRATRSTKLLKVGSDSRGAITTQSAAKIVQLKVYSVQASLTLREEELSATRLPCYYFHLLAIRELSVALNKTSDPRSLCPS